MPGRSSPRTTLGRAADATTGQEGVRCRARGIATLRGLHEEFRAAAEKEGGEQGVVVDLNALWHRAVYEAAHSTFLDELIDRLWTGVPYQAIWFIHRRHRSVRDHQAVTDALLSREADAAASAMLQHIARGDRRSRELRARPENAKHGERIGLRSRDHSAR